jgi:hypothetical protein
MTLDATKFIMRPRDAPTATDAIETQSYSLVALVAPVEIPPSTSNVWPVM